MALELHLILFMHYFGFCIYLILDVAHSMPVSQMGNYQEYLKRIPSPLREVESTPVRQHTFGNPFKIDKVFFLLLISYKRALIYI